MPDAQSVPFSEERKLCPNTLMFIHEEPRWPLPPYCLGVFIWGHLSGSMNGRGVINGLVGSGRGTGAAEPGGGLPCLPTPFPLLLSAPCHLDGVPAPCAVPSPQGQEAGCPGVTGLEGHSWVMLELWTAADQGSGGWPSPGCQQQGQSRTQSRVCC